MAKQKAMSRDYNLRSIHSSDREAQKDGESVAPQFGETVEMELENKLA